MVQCGIKLKQGLRSQFAVPDFVPSSVCGGLSAKFGQQPPDGGSARRRRQQVAPPPRRQGAEPNDNITVGCVGKATVYTLYDLVPDRQYFVSVFGQYANRSVSFQYGTAEFRWESPPLEILMAAALGSLPMADGDVHCMCAKTVCGNCQF